MRPEELVFEVLRYWWVILLAALVAAGTAYLAVPDDSATYTASARAVAVPEPPDYWLDQYAKVRLSTLPPVITSYTFVADALTAAGLDLDPGSARGKIRTTQNTATNTLTILVDDDDPQRAADITNAVLAELLRWNDAQNTDMAARVSPESEEYPPRINLIGVEQAGVPGTANETSSRSTTLAGALLGGLVGAGIVFLLIYRDDSLKTPEDLARYLGLPLLGSVPAGGSDGEGMSST